MVGSPQLLPLQTIRFGLPWAPLSCCLRRAPAMASALSAWTPILQLPAPLCGTVTGLPGCALPATPSALIGANQPLQLPYMCCTCETSSSASQSHLLLVLQVWSSAPLSTSRRPCTTSTWTPQPPSPASPSPPGWPPTRCQSVSLQPLSCAPSANLPASCLSCRMLVVPQWAAVRP